jgi:hypothetical protein
LVRVGSRNTAKLEAVRRGLAPFFARVEGGTNVRAGQMGEGSSPQLLIRLSSCAVRHESTTALQSLTLLNSEFSLRTARQLAGAVVRSHPDHPHEQIEAAYLRVFGRSARADEVRAGQVFLDSQATRVRAQSREATELALPEGITSDDPVVSAALVDLCLALFNANEFLYLD